MNFFIGDIHGCNRTFQALLQRLAPGKDDRIVLLGDYIDRGPDSKGVIDTIFQLREAGQTLVCLRGNHEQLLLDAFEDHDALERWLFNGGRQTMASFGADRLKDIPQRYIDFFNDTQLCFEDGDFICVHGGPDFSAADPLGNPFALLWARRWYAGIDYAWLGRRIILHGHTPTDIGAIREQCENLEQQRYLNLDNGCVYASLGAGKSGDLGCLLGFCLETRELTEQRNTELL